METYCSVFLLLSSPSPVLVTYSYLYLREQSIMYVCYFCRSAADRFSVNYDNVRTAQSSSDLGLH